MARRKPSGDSGVLRDAFQTQLWPLPVVGVVVAVALGIALPRFDAAVDGHISVTIKTHLFGGGPGAARTVLSSISGSLITVTSLTFSLTVVTLQLASSQFSPRLLRTFTRDRIVHGTLALFLATFTYSLVVLRTVRDAGEAVSAFVPQISVTVAVVGTLASVIGLVLFLAHLARQIRVETVLQTVHDEAEGTIEHMLDRRSDGPSAAARAPDAPTHAAPVLTRESGFLVSVDEEDLMKAVLEAGAVVVVEGFPGGSLVAGTPLGRCWALGGGRLTQTRRTQLTKRIGDALNVGPERTAAQDIAFGLRQLTDVANKALSPGINDPTTAIHALGHISGLLCGAMDFELGPRLLRDEAGVVRVVLERPGFADLLDGAIAQPRRFGSTSPNVLGRIAQLLREVGWRAHDPDQREAVTEQAKRLKSTVSSGDLAKTETAELTAAIGRIHDALDGRW